MIDIYLTDTITLVQNTSDDWGVITKVEIPNIPARVEDTNTLIKNREGKEVVSSMLIMFNIDQEITYEDTIKVLTKAGESYPLSTKENAIVKFEKTVGFSTSHYEVYL